MKSLMNQRWFLALVFVVFYKPTMFSQVPQYSPLDSMLNIVKILLVSIILAWFFLYFRKISLFFIMFLFFELWRILCTINSQDNLSSLFLPISNALIILLIVEIGIKTDVEALLDSATFVLGAYVIAHMITILMYPNGMYEFANYTQNYLFGYRNNTIMLVLPAIMFSIVRSLRLFNRLSLSSIVIMLASITCVLLAFSATAVVGICLLCVFILFALIGFFPKILNIYLYLILNIGYFFAVIIMRVQNAFAFIIVDMLGRDLTFTGRTSIWDKALDAFSKSPIFGVGEISSDASRTLIGATNAHNYYLDLMYKNGIIGFVLFLIILIICGNALYKARKFGKIPFVVSGALFSFMFMLQDEAYYTIYYAFPILALAAFIDYILPEKDSDGNYIYKMKIKRKKAYEKRLKGI